MQRFSASSAGTYMACPASANLDKVLPGFEYPIEDRVAKNAANKGTLYHTYFETIVNLPPKDIMSFAMAFEYVGKLRKTRRFQVMTEVTVSAKWLKTEPKTTLDLVLHTRDEIHVLDLKTGRIPVEAKDNEQLMFYAVAAAPLAPDAAGVRIHIVQPWADNIESVFITTEELAAFIEATIVAEQKLIDVDNTFAITEKGCLFCPANPHSRGRKGNVMCPEQMEFLGYVKKQDDEAILQMMEE